MNKGYQFLLTLGFILLPACSAIDLAYDKAPSYVAAKFDDAFDLSKNQNQQLEMRLQSFFQWHREQELLQYQLFLDQAALYNSDGITAAEFLDLNQQFEQIWYRSVSRAIDSFGDLATSLTPVQIAHYQTYFHEKSDHFDNYPDKTPEQRKLYRARRGVDRLENWFGDFDDKQGKKVINRLQQLPDLYRPWIEYRERRHKAFIVVLQQPSDPQQIKQDLHRVLLDKDTAYAEEYGKAREAYWLAYAAALEDISSWLSPKQRLKATKKLQDYARTASRLSQG